MRDLYNVRMGDRYAGTPSFVYGHLQPRMAEASGHKKARVRDEQLTDALRSGLPLSYC